MIVFYISGHGFGHASRCTELISKLTTRRPDLQIVVRTAAPPWFLDDIRSPRVEVQPLDTDTGVAQIDSLRLDEDETARRAAVFYGDFDRLAEAQARDLRQLGASLVIADIPPLAIAAAHKASHPAEDPVLALYVDRCRQFEIAPPPDDWDGVYRSTSK